MTADIAQLRPTESVVAMRQQHRTGLLRIIEQAAAISATAALIVSKAEETLARGGRVSIQPQLNMITGAHARMIKDTGMVEYLQSQGTAQQGRGE